MKRRSFLKNAAVLTGAAAVAPHVLQACAPVAKDINPAASRDFHYRQDGSFTVLQFTDTHYIAGDPRSERALNCVKEAVESVRPDLVIHTGDIVFGRPDIQSAREIAEFRGRWRLETMTRSSAVQGKRCSPPSVRCPAA